MSGKIRYLYNEETGIELVYCEHATNSYPLHNHVSVMTIGVVLDGAVVLTTDEGTKTCAQNHVFVLPPYAPHSIFASQPYTLLNICIDKTKAAGAARGDVASLLTQVLHSEEKSAELLRLLDCENAFTACCGGRPLKAQNPFISALKDHLEDAPEQPQSVGEMARSAYLSKYQFIRAFKAQVGLTPHRFQMQNRIRKAKRLLRSTATITQVALDTGFCDQSHFIKQFERQVGLPPREYKRKFRYVHAAKKSAH